ncbi:MAG: hypothetical protein OXH12_13245 [Chloroflexi bacterium]|nr:hypothetical protein [Chloroflexota bacterium]
MPNAASLDALPYRHVLPHTTALSPAGRLSIGGCDLRDLAETYGSPLYVFDEQDFRETAREFRREFESRWPEVSVLYAAKAYLSLPLADIVAEEGLGMDVVSGGELAIARAAGFPSSRLYFHGNNKSAEELDAAVGGDPVGRVVVDNFHELADEYFPEPGLPRARNRTESPPPPGLVAIKHLLRVPEMALGEHADISLLREVGDSDGKLLFELVEKVRQDPDIDPHSLLSHCFGDHDMRGRFEVVYTAENIEPKMKEKLKMEFRQILDGLIAKCSKKITDQETRAKLGKLPTRTAAKAHTED